MDEKIPLYNSRILNNYIEFLRKNYPSINIDFLLKQSKLSNYEVNDPGFWFTQENADLFHETAVIMTKNPAISKEAGRYATSSDSFNIVQKYMLGMMSIASAYMLMDRIYPTLSRGAVVKSKKIASNKIEIASMPAAGVKEKPYQCDNRWGSFESFAKWFTNHYAKIEHPECFHRGDKCCRYIIKWNETPAILWKRFNNIAFSFGAFSFILSLFFLPLTLSLVYTLSLTILLFFIFYNTNRLEKKELRHIIINQGDTAKELLNEINIRHENTLLIHEIGQAISVIVEINNLTNIVVDIIKRRLVFSRGVIMIANKDCTKLVYSSSFGYTTQQEKLFRENEFHLNNPHSKGPFVLAFKEQKPYMIDNITQVLHHFSERSREIVTELKVESMICVPIIYEQRPLGVLAVDNPRSKTPFTQSDLNLLTGVASQLAISIINALSFQRLQESEKKYRDLVENANSIIMRINRMGEITFFNEFAQRFFDHAVMDILGANILGILVPVDDAGKGYFKNLLNELQGDPNHQLAAETETVLKNGNKVWIAWTHKMIFDEENHFNEILSIGNDVTALKKSALEKKVLEDQLQQAQKMEIIGTLAGGVAHDLNNLLAGIIGYPEILLLDLPSDSPLLESIKNIKKSGERAAAVVQDLLTLARRGVPIREVVNLNRIVKEYFNSPEFIKLKQFHLNIEVEFNLEPHLHNIVGSPVHLSKALMNLVSNAAEAMPNGGTIWVSTINQYMDTQILNNEGVIAGDYVILTVMDNGIGISEADKPKIFEPFYTKKTMGRSGTGLGMTVVWGAVKDHKGHIDIQSKVGRGTRFVLYFPATSELLADEGKKLSLEAYMGKGESILIVDDLSDQLEIAKRMLQRLNYDVDTVDSGEKAVAYVLNRKVDLVILDMMMDPGIDGLETFRRIQLINPAQRVIIFSGYSKTERVKEAEHLGVGTFVKKPFLIEKIGIAVKNELSRH